MDSVDSEL